MLQNVCGRSDNHTPTDINTGKLGFLSTFSKFQFAGLFLLAPTALAIAYGALTAATESSGNDVAHNPTGCAYMPGGGFSGFPYAMGSLLNVKDPTSIDYYCYSAGCLASTAALAGAIHDMRDIADNSKKAWRNGEISRFEFVEYLVDQYVTEETFTDEKLARLHIITAIPTWMGLQSVTRTPTSVAELKLMLKQTTWIPGVTGNRPAFEDHLDAAFFTSKFGSQPLANCASALGFPWPTSWTRLAFYTNTLNMALEEDNWWKFMEMGAQYGQQHMW